MNYPDLLEIASLYRGKIINETIYLEKCMDTFIANYFCSDDGKRQEIHLLFLGDNRMTFENKKQIFDFICKKSQREWYLEYISSRDDSRKKGRVPMASDLDYVIYNRNILAHCFMDTLRYSKEENLIYFVRFKNEEEVHTYGEKDFLNLFIVVQNLINHIFESLKSELISNSPISPLLGFTIKK